MVCRESFELNLLSFIQNKRSKSNINLGLHCKPQGVACIVKNVINLSILYVPYITHDNWL